MILFSMCEIKKSASPLATFFISTLTFAFVTLVTVTEARVVAGEPEVEKPQYDYKWVKRPGQTYQDQESLLDNDEYWPVLCPPDNWYNKTLERCVECTKCGAGYETSRACYGFQDRGCVPSDNLEGSLGYRTNDAAERWRPVALALVIITGVMLFVLLVVSVALFIAWRRQAVSSSSSPSADGGDVGSAEKKLMLCESGNSNSNGSANEYQLTTSEAV